MLKLNSIHLNYLLLIGHYQNFISAFKIKILVILAFIICINDQVSGQCKSIDLVSKDSGLCQPALFKWVVTNAPSGSIYTWDYGTGTQQGQDSFYAYIQPAGKLTVTVTIKLPNSTICKITKNNFVEVFPKPVPTYYASRIKLCDGPDSVTYFDISKNSVKRSWVIDGSNYNNVQKKHRHTFSSAGIKRLSLVVEDSNGCKAMKEFDTAAIIHKDIKLDIIASKTSGCIVKSIKFKPVR